jgi:hypothetical protein
MAGALYIWIMAAVFLGVVAVIALLTILFWLGHWLEKKQSGATHGFLEIPPESLSRPVSSSSPSTTPPPPNPPPDTTPPNAHPT